MKRKSFSNNFNHLQGQLLITEMDRVKNKLNKTTASRTQGAMLRSEARWYEFGEKKNKYFIVWSKEIIRKNT